MIDYSYFQKSKAFLYPLLEIPSSLSSPIQTYLKIENFEFLSTTPIICLYNRTDKFLKDLEKFKSHKNYEFDFVLDNTFHLIIFDISRYKSDYDNVIKGMYSKLSTKLKTILNLSNPKNKIIVLCFDPELNRKIVENDLELEPESLKGSEICSAPNMTTDGEIFFIKDLNPLKEFYQ